MQARGLISCFRVGIGNTLAGNRVVERAKRTNSFLRPAVTAVAKSFSKSQKNRNGVCVPNSSPMKSRGGDGASRRISAAARTARGSAMVTILSPNARFRSDHDSGGTRQRQSAASLPWTHHVAYHCYKATSRPDMRIRQPNNGRIDREDDLHSRNNNHPSRS